MKKLFAVFLIIAVITSISIAYGAAAYAQDDSLESTGQEANTGDSPDASPPPIHDEQESPQAGEDEPANTVAAAGKGQPEETSSNGGGAGQTGALETPIDSLPWLHCRRECCACLHVRCANDT